MLLQTGIFTILLQLLRRLHAPTGPSASGAGGDGSSDAVVPSTQPESPRIAAWALLDALTTTMLKLSGNTHATASDGSKNADALLPVFAIVVSELDAVATQMKKHASLAKYHAWLDAQDAAKNAPDAAPAAPAKSKAEKKSKAKTPAAAAVTTTTAVTAKLDTAAEFGVLRPLVGGEASGSQVVAVDPSNPQQRTDVFAVKVLALLLKLVALPQGAESLVTTPARRNGRSVLVSLVSLMCQATPKVRSLASSALTALVSVVANNTTELAAVDARMPDISASVPTAPPTSTVAGAPLCAALLACLGRTFASPLVACFSLSKPACIRKTDAVDSVFASLCDYGYAGSYGPEVWLSLKTALTNIAGSGSHLAGCLHREILASLQVCIPVLFCNDVIVL